MDWSSEAKLIRLCFLLCIARWLGATSTSSKNYYVNQCVVGGSTAGGYNPVDKCRGNFPCIDLTYYSGTGFEEDHHIMYLTAEGAASIDSEAKSYSMSSTELDGSDTRAGTCTSTDSVGTDVDGLVGTWSCSGSGIVGTVTITNDYSDTYITGAVAGVNRIRVCSPLVYEFAGPEYFDDNSHGVCPYSSEGGAAGLPTWGAYTIEAEISPNSFVSPAEDRYLVTWGDQNYTLSVYGDSGFTKMYDDWDYGYQARLDTTGTSLYPGATGGTADLSGTFLDGFWHHIATTSPLTGPIPSAFLATFSLTGERKIYLDYTEVAADDPSTYTGSDYGKFAFMSDFTTGSYTFCLGSNNGGNYFYGWIQNFRIWAQSMTTAEMQAAVVLEVPGPTTSTATTSSSSTSTGTPSSTSSSSSTSTSSSTSPTATTSSSTSTSSSVSHSTSTSTTASASSSTSSSTSTSTASSTTTSISMSTTTSTSTSTSTSSSSSRSTQPTAASSSSSSSSSTSTSPPTTSSSSTSTSSSTSATKSTSTVSQSTTTSTTTCSTSSGTQSTSTSTTRVGFTTRTSTSTTRLKTSSTSTSSSASATDSTTSSSSSTSTSRTSSSSSVSWTSSTSTTASTSSSTSATSPTTAVTVASLASLSATTSTSTSASSSTSATSSTSTSTEGSSKTSSTSTSSSPVATRTSSTSTTASTMTSSSLSSTSSLTTAFGATKSTVSSISTSTTSGSSTSTTSRTETSSSTSSSGSGSTSSSSSTETSTTMSSSPLSSSSSSTSTTTSASSASHSSASSSTSSLSTLSSTTTSPTSLSSRSSQSSMTSLTSMSSLSSPRSTFSTSTSTASSHSPSTSSSTSDSSHSTDSALSTDSTTSSSRSSSTPVSGISSSSSTSTLTPSSSSSSTRTTGSTATTASSASTPTSLTESTRLQSSSSTSTTSSTTTITSELLGGSYWFQAAGCTVAEVRTSCEEAVATLASIGSEAVECTVAVGEAIRRRMQEIDSTQYRFTASYVVAVPPETNPSTVRSLLVEASGSNSTAFGDEVREALLEVVENVTLTSSSFSWGSMTLTDSDDAAAIVLQQVALQEARVLDLLLQSNQTQVEFEDDGIVAVATKVSIDSEEGFDVEVEEQFSVHLPASAPLELDATDLVLVAIDLGQRYASTGWAAQEQGEVTRSISLQLFTADGALLLVRNLTEPFELGIVVDDPSQASCAYWDEELNEWSSEGLIEGGYTNSTLLCKSNHLTIFGALAKGFLATFSCSQASLFTKEGLSELTKPWTWLTTAPLLWCLLMGLAALFVSAVLVDYRRFATDRWSDEHFFCYTGTEPDDEPDDAQPQEEKQPKRGPLAQTCCTVLTWMFHIYVEIRVTVKCVLDEILDSLFNYLHLVREICEGLFAFIWEGHRTADERGACIHFLTAIARSISSHLAHKSATAMTGTHEDDVTETLAKIEIVEEPMPEDVDGDNAPRRPSIAMLPVTSGNGNVTVQARRPSVASAGSVQSYQSAGSLAPSMASSAGNDTLVSMKVQYNERLEQEKLRPHHPLRGLQHMFIHFLFHGPIGSIYSFSIYAPSSIRCIILICEVLGTCAVSTFFMSLSKRARSVRNPSACNVSSEDLDFKLGRLIALGLCASVCSTLPSKVISSLRTRDFVSMDYKGSPAAKRQLFTWRVMDIILWTFAVLYSGACIMVIFLFFANVTPSDHVAWRITVVTGLLGDMIVMPFAMVLLPYVALMLCLIFLAVLAHGSVTTAASEISRTATTVSSKATRSVRRQFRGAKSEQSKVDDDGVVATATEGDKWHVVVKLSDNNEGNDVGKEQPVEEPPNASKQLNGSDDESDGVGHESPSKQEGVRQFEHRLGFQSANEEAHTSDDPQENDGDQSWVAFAV